LHALAYAKAEAVIANTNAPAFYANSFRALWLGDSATLVAVAIILVCIIARPLLASDLIVGLLALFPLATALLVYEFVGGFLPAHGLVAAAALMLIAAYCYPRPATQQ
jgi:hypothetical protein